MKIFNQHSIIGFLITLALSIMLPNMVRASEKDTSVNNARMKMDSNQSKEKEKPQNSMPMKTDSNDSMGKEKAPDSMSMKMNDNKATGARDPFANSGGYEYTGMGGWEETDEMTVSRSYLIN